MIQPIMKDVLFLQQKSVPATQDDLGIGRDLMDTLQAHQHECVGMAANMIGIKKRVIVVSMGFTNLVMYNPKLLKKANPYSAEESCLSLTGVRSTTRYKQITVSFFNQNWQEVTMDFTDFTAQIIQHELDHLEGIII